MFALEARIATLPLTSACSFNFLADSRSYVWAVLASTVEPLVDGTFLGLNFVIKETPRFSTLLFSEPLESTLTLVSDFLTDFETPFLIDLAGMLSPTPERRLSVMASLLVDLLGGALSVS